MPGFCGTVGIQSAPCPLGPALETLDRLDRCQRLVHEAPELSLAVAPLAGAPLGGPYLFEDDRLVGGFAGDLIDQAVIPWERISRDLANDRLDWLCDCDSHFAAALYHKPERTFYLVGDHFAYRPLFYRRVEGGLLFGTNLPSLLMLGAEPGLDEDWFHRFMYFGYWPGQATFLQGAQRMAPGSALVYRVADDRLELRSTGIRLKKTSPPLRGRQAIDLAKDVFRERAPRYFGKDHPVEVALSGGLDTRTVLAYLPAETSYQTFTYGAPGSPDQVEAAIVARQMDLPHRTIEFDDAYEPKLSRLIYEVVWLSGGLAWCHRAMLPHIYSEIDRYRPRTPILMSGISLDILFRGHNNARGDLDTFLRTGNIVFSQPQYAQIFGDRLGAFQDHVCELGVALNQEHGDIADSQGYLNYLVYTLLPSYFSSDLEIGGNHAMLRVPGWDRAIIRLAYEIENSTIYLSKFLPHDRFQEFVLQAHLMSTNPRVAQVPLHGLPLWVWTNNNRAAYHVLRLAKHGPRFLVRGLTRGKSRTPIEPWNRWFASRLVSEMESLLTPDCRLAQFVDPACFRPLIEAGNWPWVGRLASVEIILQLMHNGWDLDALPYPGLRSAGASRSKLAHSRS